MHRKTEDTGSTPQRCYQTRRCNKVIASGRDEFVEENGIPHTVPRQKDVTAQLTFHLLQYCFASS